MLRDGVVLPGGAGSGWRVVVVDHVHQDGDAVLMAGFDELLEPVPATGSGVDGEKVRAAVALREAPVELEHRHQLHRVHSEIQEVGDEVERIGECAG